MIAVFACALILIAYTYAGYPCLLWWRARRADAGVGLARPPDGGLPRIAVVIPAYNEQDVIVEKLQSVLASRYPAHLMRVIVVSDGSRDATLARVRALSDPRLLIIERRTRAGKAAALNIALALVTEPIVIMTDAGETLDADAIGRLVARFEDPRIGAVSGELGLVSLTTGLSQGLGVYWRYEKAIRQWEASVGSVVGVTGPIYALRRDVFRPLPIDTILDDLAIPLEVVRQGYRVGYERRAFAYEKATQIGRHEFIRKRRTLAGNYQAIARYGRLLLPGSPVAWPFWSHKVCRLIAPYALLAMLVSAPALPGLWGPAVETGQWTFYGLAALAAFRHRSKRPWLTFPYTFCLLHCAALAGSYDYLAGRASAHWEKVK